MYIPARQRNRKAWRRAHEEILGYNIPGVTEEKLEELAVLAAFFDEGKYTWDILARKAMRAQSFYIDRKDDLTREIASAVADLMCVLINEQNQKQKINLTHDSPIV